MSLHKDRRIAGASVRGDLLGYKRGGIVAMAKVSNVRDIVARPPGRQEKAI
jgi:hypothetical protein